MKREISGPDSNVRLVAEKPIYRTFDNMCWPCPGERLSDLAWVLTWGTPTKGDHLLAAAVIGAYCQMIGDPAKHRQRVIAELRQGPNLPRKRESAPASLPATAAAEGSQETGCTNNRDPDDAADAAGGRP